MAFQKVKMPLYFSRLKYSEGRVFSQQTLQKANLQLHRKQAGLPSPKLTITINAHSKRNISNATFIILYSLNQAVEMAFQLFQFVSHARQGLYDSRAAVDSVPIFVQHLTSRGQFKASDLHQIVNNSYLIDIFLRVLAHLTRALRFRFKERKFRLPKA